MPDDPGMRASDDDRDRAASLLREHHAAGRLTVEEFQERLDAAYQAKTLGEIDQLMADLPSIDLYHLPDESMRRMARAASSRRPRAPRRRSRQAVTRLAGGLGLVGLGQHGSLRHLADHRAGQPPCNGLWFLWVAGPWGAVLLGRWLFGAHPASPGRQLPGPPASRAHELRAQRQAEREAERRERRDRRGGGPREF